MNLHMNQANEHTRAFNIENDFTTQQQASNFYRVTTDDRKTIIAKCKGTECYVTINPMILL